MENSKSVYPTNLSVISGLWKKCQKHILKLLEQHPFVSQIRFILPSENNSLPFFLPSDNTSYFYNAKISLSWFLSLNENNLNRYNIISQSIHTPLSHSVLSAAFYQNVLYLSVDLDLYQRLGLVGQRTKNPPYRYLISIDTSTSYMKKGKKGYDRIFQCISQLKPIEMLILFTSPTLEEIEKPTFDSYESVFLPLSYQQVQYTLNSPIPHIFFSPLSPLECTELFSWAGLVSNKFQKALLKSSSNNNPLSSFISNYIPLKNISSDFGNISTSFSQGFFNTQHIILTYNNIFNIISSLSVEWVGIVISSFPDSPVYWNSNQPVTNNMGKIFHCATFFNGQENIDKDNVSIYCIYGESELMC